MNFSDFSNLHETLKPVEIIIIVSQKYIKYSFLCQFCSEKCDFDLVRNTIWRTIKVCIDFMTM